MDRRTVIGGLAAATGALLVHTEANARTTFSSNGFGLKVDQFTAIHGPGEPGQTYIQYPQVDGQWFVGQDNASGVVDFIERYWNPESRSEVDAARAEAESLLPADSILNETYTAQFGYIGYSTIIERYRSGTLKQQFGDSAISTNAIFVVMYEMVPSNVSMAQLVLRFSILAAQAPE